MNNALSQPDRATLQQQEDARRYRSGRRPSLQATWSETSLSNHNGDTSSSSSNNLLVFDPQLLTPTPTQRTQTMRSTAEQRPDLPPRRVSTPAPVALSMQHAPRRYNSRGHAAPPLPMRMSLDSRRPTGGLMPLTSTTRIHRASANIQTDLNVISAPPVTSFVTVEPSAPPLPQQPSVAHSEMEPDTISSSSRSSSSSGLASLRGVAEPRGLRHEPTMPPEEVQRVALRDAKEHGGEKMFSDKVLNFRDIGASVIKLQLKLHDERGLSKKEGPMPGVVFRSAELGSAGEKDVKTLFSRYGIRTIIDLRSELEARASDILTKHYPASLEPTQGQSMEKLVKLRQQQIRQTIVEVAAHDYEGAARPWERTGDSQHSWNRKNTLRYSRMLGDARNDPLARALSHLYDRRGSDSETQITEQAPYVPVYDINSQVPEPVHLEPPHAPLPSIPSEPTSPTDGKPAHHSLSGPVDMTAWQTLSSSSSHQSLPPPPHQQQTLNPVVRSQRNSASSALDWGDETLQHLRSCWDNATSQLADASVVAPAEVIPPPPAAHIERQPSPVPAPRPHITIITPSMQVGEYIADASDSAAAGSNSKTNGSDDEEEEVTSISSGDEEDIEEGFDDNYEDSDSGIKINQPVDDMPFGLKRVSNPPARTSMSSISRVSGNSNHWDSPDDTVPKPIAYRASTAPLQESDKSEPNASVTRRQLTPHNEQMPRFAERGRNRRHMIRSNPSGMPLGRTIIENRFDGRRRRFRCNVLGDNYRRKCVWASAPWSTKLKVILRFATFNKAEAIRTIGREVLAPRGLAGSYEDYVDYCKEEFASVMRIFADPCAYPILFHCQHGKDRTGIIAALLLGILEVDDEIIAQDYALSQANLVSVRHRMETLDMGAVGLPPSFCDTPAPVMRNLMRHIRKNYGSVRGYLRTAGMREQEINTIAWCLRGNFCGIVHAQTRRAQSQARKMYLRPSMASSDIFDRPKLEQQERTDSLVEVKQAI